MIKELLRVGDSRYFEGEREGEKIFFEVFEYCNTYTLEEIEKAFKNADIPGYLKGKYTLKSILLEPLGNLFKLDIYKWGNTLNPKNFNLFEYEMFIKGNNDPHPSLKSACICKGREESYFYIALEEYDHTSCLNKENKTCIRNYLLFNTKAIEKILGYHCSHVEEY